ncbi:MAG: hypothetical protein ABI759_03490 [Candidatus Solibacter sp.]
MKNLALWLKGMAAATLGGTVASAAQAAASGTVEPANLKAAAITGVDPVRLPDEVPGRGTPVVCYWRAVVRYLRMVT